MGNGQYHVIFEKDSWEIEIRPRNNVRSDEPNMKVWICKSGQELAQYTDKYRGYGSYKNHEELLPPDLVDIAKKAWGLLKEYPYDKPLDDEMLEKLKSIAAPEE